MELRVTTFNVENLFNRYLFLDAPGETFEKQILPTGIASLTRSGEAESATTTLLQRNNTARVILEAKPDILAVAEVEDLRALRAFNEEYLDGYFDRMIMLEGNDGRGIDVGLCIRKGCAVDVVGIRTHADERRGSYDIDRYFDPAAKIIQAKNALFSRDCLEVDVDVVDEKQDRKVIAKLTFLVNHLKSQSGDSKEAKADAAKLRGEQAQRVAQLATIAKKAGRMPIVLGDLNEDWKKKDTVLAPLKDLVGKTLADPTANLADEDRWTHYFMVAKSVSQLDYILPDQSIALGDVSVIRKGLTLKCRQYEGDRYPTVGYTGTEASDHCALSVVLKFATV